MMQVRVVGTGADPLDYLEGWRMQREAHARVSSRESEGEVLLCEHPSVYTAGRRTEAHERPDDGSPVIDVDRGGKLTWHGPGQLVGYPIVRLVDPIDVVAYVRTLEGVLIEVLSSFGIDGVRIPGRSGVWIEGAGPAEKIAAIGIRVAEGVTMHGFALNVANPLEPYRHIVACGISDAGVTTVSRVLGREVAVADVVPVVSERLLAAFAASSAASSAAAPDETAPSASAAASAAASASAADSAVSALEGAAA